MTEKVNLFFFPEVEEGEDEEEVKQKLSKTLSVDEEKVDTWFASSRPTIILKGVEVETAMKYVEAIRGCGAKCDIQTVGADEWSLEQMTAADIHDFFICPSCEHEEEIERGAKIEQCPKCGLVIAKWEEKMREEAEKEKIRRRLMRDQRLQGDREAELEKKRSELERLKELEREIMLELGIKPPSRLWMIFEQYTISISFAITCVIIIATGIAFRYADMYMEKLAQEQLVASEPSEEIQAMTPVMSAAVQLNQNGNGNLVTEVADMTEQLRGLNEQRRDIVESAQLMMKGADATQFLAAASQMQLPNAQAALAPGDVAPPAVNIDTIGGVTGMTGVTSFAPDTLNQISPPLLEHGHENVLTVLSEKKVIPDPIDPEGPELVVEAIDELDGSMMVDLMNTLSRDQEWDQYLLTHVRSFVEEKEFDEASELTNRIKNSVVRVEALGVIMVGRMLNEQPNEIKLLKARVRLDLDRIKDVDTKAKVLLQQGRQLSEAGVKGEPSQSIDRVDGMASDSSDQLERAGLFARIAVAMSAEGNLGQAKAYFKKAQEAAGSLKSQGDRIAAFTRIAQRYYDARNTTMANEILSEASVLAASELEPAERSKAFGEIAIAQGYLGDFAGARISIDNAGKEIARDQLLAKLAESLIGLGRYYEALSAMEPIQNEVEYNRLELRLISRLIHDGREAEAVTRIAQGSPRVKRIYDLSERGLLTSQYGRLFMRLDMEAEARAMFDEAMAISNQLGGRKSDVNKGIVALDWSRSLHIGEAYSVIRQVEDTVISEPIGNEILATERIIKNLLPEWVREEVLTREEQR